MNFKRSYPEYRYRDYLTAMYLMNRYLDMRLSREQRGNTQQNTNAHDPLLYMTMGYLASLALISYLTDNSPANHPGVKRNFDISLERRTIFRGPIHYRPRQNPNYMNR